MLKQYALCLSLLTLCLFIAWLGSLWAGLPGGNGVSSKKHLEGGVCAPWIPNDRRVVEFRSDRLANWESYQNLKTPRKYLGGESYWSASVDYVLRYRLGFRVRFLNKKEISYDPNVYRIITDVMATEVVDGGFNTTCKMRSLSWWGETTSGLDKRHKVVAFPSQTGVTQVPFFVHSQLTLPPLREITTLKHNRSALILGKKCKPDMTKLQALLESDFLINIVCKDKNQAKELKQEIALSEFDDKINHIILHEGLMKPIKFARLLRSVAMVIGMDHPWDSPTPFEGLANGAAFLNPLRMDNTARSSQNVPIERLGRPYVYNYNDTKSLVQSALLASEHRFVSFIPEHHRISSVEAAVCSNLIESNALCECPDCPGSFHETMDQFPRDTQSK